MTVHINGTEIQALAPRFERIMKLVGRETNRETFLRVRQWLAINVKDLLKVNCIFVVLLKAREGPTSEMARLDDIAYIRFRRADKFMVKKKDGKKLVIRTRSFS